MASKNKHVPSKHLQIAAILEAASDAITVQTLDGTILRWNKGAEKLCGYTAKEIIGKSFSILLPVNRLDEVSQIADLIKTGESVNHYDTIRKRKDGTLISVSISVSPIKDNKGRIIGASTIARDITEQKNEEDKFRVATLNILEDLSAEKKALQKALNRLGTLDKMRDTILNSGHELKSPLGPIKIQSQMLLAGDLGNVNSKQKASLHMILNNVDRLNRVMTDITDTAKLESNSVSLVYEKISMAGLIKEAVKQLDIKAKEGGISMVVRHMALPPVSADRQRIMEVITNLLENAIKFTPAKGRIVVAAEKVKDKVLVRITDTGIGISKENQKKLFTRFFQVDSSITRRFGGTGLGLSICKGIIEAHHGKIWVESKGLGRGSTFSFTLPAV
jgi:PAS domain S-box-containing protein